MAVVGSIYPSNTTGITEINCMIPKWYTCRFCNKKFSLSQAIAGHTWGHMRIIGFVSTRETARRAAAALKVTKARKRVALANMSSYSPISFTSVNMFSMQRTPSKQSNKKLNGNVLPMKQMTIVKEEKEELDLTLRLGRP
ncbi:hypothetical protein FRX31_033071 [Thalictrum thalictroides]|uniref:C2H2-type domain-containing protein n=1 Tax=Thalictrum thalictroides TaxID=46969 RepID=A0A7J6UYT3_THATH|nr:hypothetical protein FRX31_033071 [Thalictrum thalictroides]